MSHEWYDVTCPSIPIGTRKAYLTVSHEYAAQLWLDQNLHRRLINRALLFVSSCEGKSVFRIHLNGGNSPCVSEVRAKKS